MQRHLQRGCRGPIGGAAHQHSKALVKQSKEQAQEEMIADQNANRGAAALAQERAPLQSGLAPMPHHLWRDRQTQPLPPQVKHAERQRTMLDLLSHLRYLKMVPSAHIDSMRDGIKNILSGVATSLVESISPMLSPAYSAQDLRTALDGHLNIFKGVETSQRESSMLRKLLGDKQDDTAWLTPVRHELVDPKGEFSGDVVYDFPADKLLKRLVLNSPQVCT